MRVLAIGSDRNIFLPESEGARRQIAYGDRFGELDIIIFTQKKQRYERQTLASGVHVYPTKSYTRWLYVWDAFRLGRTLSHPDVITAQDPFEAGLVGLLLARVRRVPLHVQVHTDLYHPAFAQSLLNRFRLLIAGMVLPRATRIRVVSERVRRSIFEKYPNATISVLPIFVDIEHYRNARPGTLTEKFAQFKTRLLVVSRLEPEKNVAFAIESFKKTASADTCLIIVGNGSERTRLEAQASPRVFFEGEQDPAPYYAIADLVLVTSRYEGYGRTIVEALAAGKPVLATDVGVAREAGAIIADADFAASLALWLRDGKRTDELSDYPYNTFAEYVHQYCGDIDISMKKRSNSH